MAKGIKDLLGLVLPILVMIAPIAGLLFIKDLGGLLSYLLGGWVLVLVAGILISKIIIKLAGAEQGHDQD